MSKGFIYLASDMHSGLVDNNLPERDRLRCRLLRCPLHWSKRDSHWHTLIGTYTLCQEFDLLSVCRRSADWPRRYCDLRTSAGIKEDVKQANLSWNTLLLFRFLSLSLNHMDIHMRDYCNFRSVHYSVSLELPTTSTHWGVNVLHVINVCSNFLCAVL